MRYVLSFIVFVAVSGCQNDVQQLKSSNLPFDKVFSFVDSTEIDAENLMSMIGVLEGKGNTFLMIDYNGRKVVEFDSSGRFVKDVINNEKAMARNKRLGSPISALGVGDNLFIADNNNRRIYIVDTSTNVIENSFILAGTHMTPVHMALVKDHVIMSGYNIQGDMFLNMYDTQGIYLQSFMESSSRIDDEKYIISPLNYVHLATSGDTLYTVELMDYTINAFDAYGRSLFQKRYNPDYFKPLTENLLRQAESSFEDIREQFSKPSRIEIADGKLLVQVEMPSIGTKHNYFNTRDYRLDIFDLQGNPLHVGIKAGNLNLLYYSSANGMCYFLSGYDSGRKIYTVKKYRLSL
jgi:hypothetical protein